MSIKEKLLRLGIRLPLLPLTSVGSFPKLSSVVSARKLFLHGDQRRRIVEEEATRYWIRKQEELDYHVLVHGEQERGDMVAYFGEEFKGMVEGDKEEPVRSYGNRYWIPPEINGPVRWKGPVTLGMWNFAKSLTPRPVKGMLTGPATIYDWSLDVYYRSRQEGVLDIAGTLRKEIEALIETGAKIIQIDEPSLTHTWRYFATLKAAFEIMLKGLGERAYFIFHTCYAADTFEEIYPKMLELPVDNLDLETANSNMKFLEIIARYPIIRDLSLGVVDVHSHDTEPIDVVENRIRQALGVVPAERLWLDPDCGLKTRTREEALAKLGVIRHARNLILSKI